jgi:Protein of unknown function (DUF998)
LAFTAENRRQVETFHRAALEAGGEDNGAPGLRPHYHANYYAAFVIGPDGHNIEVVCHEPGPDPSIDPASQAPPLSLPCSTQHPCDIQHGLLIVGVAAAAVFVAILLVEGALRRGYDPTYHMSSALSLGDRGWIQIANFLQLGLGTLAFAVGVHQALNSVVAAVLVAIFGVGAIVAGVCRMDPMRGYPPGTQSGTPPTLTWHHHVHDVAVPIMFFAIFGACLALVGRLQGLWRLYTILTTVAGFALARLDGSRVAQRRQEHGTRTTRPHPRVLQLDRAAGRPSLVKLLCDALTAGSPSPQVFTSHPLSRQTSSDRRTFLRLPSFTEGVT